MIRRYALLGMALCLVLAGCARPPVAGLLDVPTTAPYTLASGDRLRIIVFGQENLSNIYAVDASGQIALPLIGEVSVRNQTVRAVEGIIAARLRGRYLREPKVTVEIDAYRPFFILGEVTTSGQFAFVYGMTVQTAVAIAGGYTPRADKSYAEITRPLPEGLAVGNVPVTAAVRPGDTLVIKERWF